MYGYEEYLNQDVFILQHPLGEDVYSATGKIISINNFEFEHTVIGSPVLLYESSKVIGIHKKKKQN